MPLSEETQKEVRERIDEEIVALQTELADLGFPADGTVDVSFDENFADAAQTTSERARAMSLAEGLRQRLQEARVAIGRIERGVYGKCERCGDEIGPERLEAVPTTRLCITCKHARR